MSELHDPSLYINRELSWLQFNSRVLAQAKREELPPLERLKFLAIYGTNLDEFYMIRVAGLMTIYKARIQQTGPDKTTPAQQLQKIREYLHNEQRELEKCYFEIVGKLSENGVKIGTFDSLTQEQKELIEQKFENEIYPVIIPIAVDATHPFPHLNNLSFGLALSLEDSDGNIKHGLVRIPRILPRFVKVDRDFVAIESIVEHFVSSLFPGLKLLASTPFRVTRDADIEIEEEEADDFLEILQEGLRSRNRGQLVRLELQDGAKSGVVEFLKTHLNLEERDIYGYKDIPIALGSLWEIVSDKELSHLLLPPFSPRILPPLDTQNIFDAIKSEDIVLYHPYDSFEPVVSFITKAAVDPDVIAIRMTLYRVGRRSPIVKALIDSAKEGKQVMVLVELKARFDEENNLKWAKALEQAGAHVVYGIPGLKVHAKIAQVIRKEDNNLRSYLHIATGNYNPTTAKLYTDFSYFTCKQKYIKDATHFFHFLTGFSGTTKLKSLYMSPTQIKPKLLKMIKNESEFGEDGQIILKANSLVDEDIIRALYVASEKGCHIDLIIRGICALRPNVKGVSENIRVFSIIGKYLEHPRVFFFKHDKNRYYISSADLMPRNLIRRIELMTPIVENALQQKIQRVLSLQLSDNDLKWELLSDGRYIKESSDNKRVDSQALFEELTKKTSRDSNDTRAEYIKKLVKKLTKRMDGE